MAEGHQWPYAERRSMHVTVSHNCPSLSITIHMDNCRVESKLRFVSRKCYRACSVSRSGLGPLISVNRRSGRFSYSVMTFESR